MHTTSLPTKFLSATLSILANALICTLILLSSDSSSEVNAPQESQTLALHCRYIQDGRLYSVEIAAPDWQTAEEIVCGAVYRDVRLPPLILEGVQLLLPNPEDNPIVMAQRESCSCTEENEVPILQDVGIVEAARLGAEDKRTALPRIINTPEPTTENVVNPNTTKKTERKADKKLSKTSLDDILNAATNFDEARPISDYDPGGSADGSIHSKSATGRGDPYLQKVKAKLDNTMQVSSTIPKSELRKLKAQITITIFADGTVSKWRFLSKSGNKAFDGMIEYTMGRFMLGGNLKFAPPPDQWKLKEIGITVDGNDL